MSVSPLKDLLRMSMQRARIQRSVASAQIVSFVNNFLPRILDSSATRARAVAYSAGSIKIYVDRSAVGALIRLQEKKILHEAQAQFPGIEFSNIIIKVVRHLRENI